MFKSSWKGKVRIGIICSILLVSFCFSMFQGGFVSWFILYSILPIVLYLVGLYAYMRSNIEVIICMNQTQYAHGETATVTVRLNRSFFLPIWSMRVTLPSENNRVQPHLYVTWFKKQLACELTIPSVSRGTYIFNRLLVEVSDPFGIVTLHRTLSTNEQHFTVLPKLVELQEMSYDRLSAQGLKYARKRLEQDMSVVTGVRDYQAGDRFSIIDWKTTARKNKMQTKEFERSQSNEMLVVLDADPSPLLEEKITYTASFIHHLTKQEGQVNFWTNGANQTILPVGKDDRQKLKVMYTLAQIGRNHIPAFLPAWLLTTRVIQQSNTVMIVTDNITDSLIERLSQSTYQQHSVQLFVLKKKETLNETEKEWKERASYAGIVITYVPVSNFQHPVVGVKVV